MDYQEDKFNSPDEVLMAQREEEALDPEFEFETPEMSDTDEEIIERFQQHSADMKAYWDDVYNDMAEDWDMYTLDQWTESASRARGKRPRVTIDITRKFVKSVVAETFRNPPGVKLSARSEDGDKKAKYISDAIRYFEDRTGAIYAYSWAKECAAVGGIGWLKVTYRYDEQQAMPAVIDVDRVVDPLSVMIDPDSVELDGSDALFAMEIHGKKDRKEKYTYWWKDDEGVKWALICGTEIEDKGFFPSVDIPLVPVYGEIYRIRNQAKVFGMVRQLVDTQRAYNYSMSEAVERLALTPKSPIKAVQGAIPEAYKRDWVRSMTEPVPILTWNNIDANGNPTIPEPLRSDSTPDTAWIGPMLSELQNISNQTTGIFPDSYGDRKGAESGVAIRARMEGADRGQLVYDEHLQISIKQIGLIMLDLLDPVVTPAGLLPLMGEDGTKSTIEIGMPQQMIDPQTGMMVMMEPELPDLDVTDMEISVSAAPAYATRKQEGIDKITEMLPVLPPDQQAALTPKILRDLDMPGADEYADLISPDPKKMNPIAMQQQMQQLEQQMQQMQQMNQELQNQNMQLSLQLNNNTQAMLAKAELDNQTKLAIEQMKQQGSMTETAMKIQADAQSDDKRIIAGHQQTATKAKIDLTKMSQDAQLAMAKMSKEADKDNAEITLKALKQQQDLSSKIDVQPTQIFK